MGRATGSREIGWGGWTGWDACVAVLFLLMGGDGRLEVAATDAKPTFVGWGSESTEVDLAGCCCGF